MRLTDITTYRTPSQPSACFVALRTDSGLTGLGESCWGAAAVQACLHETAARVLAGIDDHSPMATGAALRPYARLDGPGAEVRGNGSIDVALWDLLGHASGQPASRLLGGPTAASMRVYDTCAG